MRCEYGFQQIGLDTAADRILSAAWPLHESSMLSTLRDWSDEGVFWHDGNLVVDGDFESLHKISIVGGDLEVSGTFVGDQEAMQLTVVLGDVRSHGFLTGSEVFVRGDMEIANILYGSSCCDFQLRVVGNLRASLLVERGHSMSSGRKLHADVGAALDAGVAGADGTTFGVSISDENEFAAVAIDGLVDAEGELQVDILRRCVLEGRSILK